MANIAIVGAGLMGTATAFPLSDNGHSVRLVGTHLDGEIIRSCKEKHYHPRLKRELPPSVRSYYVEEMAEALKGVDIIVSGVNSYGVHWIGRTLGPHLKPGQSIIAITKGLEATAEGDLVILPDVLAGELPATIRDGIRLAAVGGPCIAGELAGRRHSCVVFGSRDREAVEKLAAVFRTSYYHVWTTTDLVGLEFCAALKNAYTLGVGMVLGLLERAGGTDSAGAYMHNLAAAIFAQACTEIERILEVVGGNRTFAYGLPGPGRSVCDLCRRTHDPIGKTPGHGAHLRRGTGDHGRRNAGGRRDRPDYGKGAPPDGRTGIAETGRIALAPHAD